MGYCLLSTATHGLRETDICQELPSCSYQDYVHCVMAILLVVQMAVRCLISVIIVEYIGERLGLTLARPTLRVCIWVVS